MSVVYSAPVGTYEVSMGFTKDPNRATNVPVTVAASGVTTDVIVDQSQAAGCGANAQDYQVLGTFTFVAGDTVTVSNTGTDGYVVADDMRFECAQVITWEEGASKNCYPTDEGANNGAGADLNDDCCPRRTSTNVGDVSECQQLCIDTPPCDGITFDGTRCFLRYNTVLESCATSSGWTSYHSPELG